MRSWRIATWNLNRAGAKGLREDRLRACIQDVNADVWVLTETHREFCPSPHHILVACSAPAPDRDKSKGEVWLAIWVRG
jgi:hypothetical protein